MPRRKVIDDDVDEITEQMGRRGKEKPDNRKMEFIPTGSTLLNLALSDRTDGGWLQGSIANIIGDSHAGKSILALTTFADTAHDKRFNKFSLIYDDAEEANSFNMTQLFGSKTADRLEPPVWDDNDNPFYSETIEDFEEFVCELSKRQFIYILDSFDSISSEGDDRKDRKRMSDRRKGVEGAGDYAMAKQKAAGRVLRKVKKKMKALNSWCGIVSQTRDKIGAMFEKNTRSGGRALKFYACHEVWLSVGKKIQSGVTGRPSIGVQCIIKIKKNKVTGKERRIEIPIYPSYGIDDYASCFDFLVKEKVFKKIPKSKSYNVDALGIDNRTKKGVIEACEDMPEVYEALKKVTGETWKGIEDSLKLDRKPKYG